MEKPFNTYWRANLKYLSILLSIWFLVSFGFGILFVDFMNQFQIGGFKLGFWFAQQGSIYVFVVLIFLCVFLMNRLDDKTSEDWWFGVSPEGFGTLAMCANILVAILISYRTPAPPKAVQLMVDEIRKP